MRKAFLPPSMAAVLLSLAACAGARVAVPPAIDLSQYAVIGLVGFTCNEEGKLDEYVTDQFLEYILADQLGVRVVELGPQERLLADLGRDQMDAEAVIAVADKYRLAAVFLGELTVDDVKPRVSLSSIIGSLSVRAAVEARLKTRLLERETGATIWTASSAVSHTVGQVQAFGDGTVIFDAEDPAEAYGDLVEDLVEAVTVDFRVTWRRVKKR